MTALNTDRYDELLDFVIQYQKDIQDLQGQLKDSLNREIKTEKLLNSLMRFKNADNMKTAIMLSTQVKRNITIKYKP